MAQRLKTDWILFSTTLAMVFFGLVILYSASSVMAEMKFQSSWHFVLRQSAWVVVSVCAMMLLKRTHYRNLQNPGVAFAALGCALTLLVAVYFLDAKNHRWLRVGPVGIQPSELAKPALVLFLAFFVARRSHAINHRHTLLPAGLAVGLVTIAVVIADLGTAVVLVATAAAVFFVAGLERRYCAIALAIISVGACGAIFTKTYRIARLVGFFDPEFKLVDRLDPNGVVKERLRTSLTLRDTSYQGIQSKIAVGSGGATGLGMMQGKQKLFYLPEAHTDFIYAVICEELGIVGSIGVLGAFLVILWRGLRATVFAPDEFGRYLALGVTTTVVVQALINLSVVLDLAPTKGIPLPMISFGGSSLMSTLASLGILMNVSEHAG